MNVLVSDAAVSAAPMEDVHVSQGGGLKLTRRGRFVLIALPMLLVATALLVAIGLLTSPLKAGTEPLLGTGAVAVTVQPGDSLWSLAGQAALPRDAGDVVAEIVELNSLSSAVLQPGQSILLPSR